MKHADTERCLFSTIEAIRCSHKTLVFHDQCALNIGFKDRFGTLESKFNHFVKPDSDEPPAEAVIVHYLDRPKPWDPAYSSKACGLWFESWYKLAIHIGGGEAMNLYRLSNLD
jgi:lipopolysaccharide biosynthesis glycosyltransferase